MNKKRLLELNRIFDEQVERLIANEDFIRKFMVNCLNLPQKEYQ